MKDDTEQLEALTGLLTTLRENPILAQLVPQDKVLGAWNSIVAASGVEDPEQLSIDIEEFMKQQEAAAQEQMAMEQQAAEQQAMQSEEVPTEQVAPELPPEMPEPNPVDEQIVAQLTALGVPEDLIAQSMRLIDEGATADEIIQALGVANG